MKNKLIVLQQDPGIEPLILNIRGQKVILDRDLADIYEVLTKALNQAVNRNIEKFPGEFYFQLTKNELTDVVTNCDHLKSLKFSHTLPHVFTEHGALMAATVLNSPRATQMSLFIIRTFTKMRELLHSREDLQKKLKLIENKLSGHDIALRMLFDDLQFLLKTKK